MKTIKSILLPVLLLIAASGMLHAQQEKGDEQTQVSLNYINSSGTGMFYGMYKFSFFATKHLEYGLAYNLQLSTGFTNTDIAPFFNYNILSKTGKFVFYFGATLDFSKNTLQSVDMNGNSTTNSNSYVGYGGNAGIRIYATEQIFYTLEQKIYSLGDANGTTNYWTTAGIGILLKKKK